MLNSIVLSGRRLTISEPTLAKRSRVAAPAGTAELLPEPANLLIFHDGQNLGAWEAVETINGLAAAGEIPPTLLVGIDHTGERRIREFGYGAAGYARFVVREVVPYIRKTYDVRRDRASTWMAGSSMGGLVTLHTAALYPDVFGRLLVLSPSVWWNRRTILRAVKRPGILGGIFSRSNGLRADVDVWLSIGLNEGHEAVSDTRRLRQTLIGMRHGDGSRLRYYEDPDGAHNEASWARQLRHALPLSGPSAD